MPVSRIVSGISRWHRTPSLSRGFSPTFIEALAAFEREAYFASAVMLGAASEKELYLLAEAILLALKDPVKQSKLKRLSDRRKLLETVRDTIHEAVTAKVLLYTDSEGSTT